ncbi:MAG: molybdopterin biosynthesis protein [Methanothrix sp.]|nr:molybdopterin biosynthesis protein [Methanothrix sp.]
MPKEFRNLIALDAAQSIVMQHLPVTHTKEVSLREAKGSILAHKIVSTIDVPGFSRASKDGFAVQAIDTIKSREDRPVSLRLTGRVPMGRQPDISIFSGEAAEVSTGSMMPPGADAVVMIEYSEAASENVFVRRPVYSGENIQAAGSDISFGEAILFPGTRLQPREIGVLAALGCSEVPVKTLKVAVASTGNELIAPGLALAAGQIYDINTYTIASAVEDCGGQAIHYGILLDQREAMTDALLKMARECDMILVSGSTSAGVGDMIYLVIDEIGDLIFHGVNFKPGKPVIFGTINGKPCMGLPGYPTSALTVFSCLAAPAIRAALGRRHTGMSASGRLAEPLRTEGRRQMMAVGLSGKLVYPVDKGSGSITTLAGSDGVIDIPAGMEYLEKGREVQVELFSEEQSDQLVIAGENSPILERLAEIQPGSIRLLYTGSLQARLYLESCVADLAIVLGSGTVPEGASSIWSIKREMGLVFQDSRTLRDLSKANLVGWHRDSINHAAFEACLLALGLAHPRYVRVARTQSAVAAAVASGLADVGYAERQVAEEAGLGFELLKDDEIMLLARRVNKDDHRIKSLLQALSGMAEAERS